MAPLWKRFIYYFIYTPLYELILSPIKPERREALELIRPVPGEKWLIVGCGTGLDLEMIPQGASITAVDINPSMVLTTIKREKKANLNIDARTMDPGSLLFKPESFDIVILHLALSKMPDPGACLLEVARILKPHGRISILDRFPPGRFAHIRKRPWLYRITETLFSGISQDLEPLLKKANLAVKEERMDPLKSRFKIIIAVKGKNNKNPHMIKQTAMEFSGAGIK